MIYQPDTSGNPDVEDGFPKAREYHYAPVSGVIRCMVDGEWETVEGWPGHHELIERFMRLRSSGEIVLLKTVNFGHCNFSGHSGRVDIYGCPNATGQSQKASHE